MTKRHEKNFEGPYIEGCNDYVEFSVKLLKNTHDFKIVIGQKNPQVGVLGVLPLNVTFLKGLEFELSLEYKLFCITSANSNTPS